MEIGRKRQRITLQRRARTQDAWGDSRGTDTWTALATVWASITPLRGGQLLAAQQVQSETTHRIFIRYQSALSDLSAADRVVYGSKTFDILSVLNIDERNAEYEIMAKER